jgi:hypothetical protein
MVSGSDTSGLQDSTHTLAILKLWCILKQISTTPAQIGVQLEGGGGGGGGF